MQDWQLIVDKYGPMVWKIAYRLLADFQDAQDCFQETFLSALELSKNEPVKNICGLLARIANSKAIDRLRKRYRCELNDSLDFNTAAGTHPAPENIAHTTELAEQLRQALAQIPPQEAQMFCFRNLDDLSYRRIAKLMGINKSTVGVTLHRVKQKLREIIERQDDISEKKVRYNNES